MVLVWFRTLAAGAAGALGVALAAAWIDAHNLLWLPTPADPARWLYTLYLAAGVVAVAFVVDLLLPVRPSDFGGGISGYVAAAVCGAIGLFWFLHFRDTLPNDPAQMLSQWRPALETSVRFGFYAFAATTLPRWLMMLHKRRAQAVRNRLSALDRRFARFSLFLRPFDLDPVLENWSRVTVAESLGLQLNRTNGIEEELAELVYDAAPLFAVGESAIGARRLLFTDDAWKHEVGELMKEAAAIFFIPGSSPGALWEARQVAGRSNYLLHKTLWLMPPKRQVSTSYKVAEAWEKTRAQLAEHGIQAPGYDDWGGVFMAHEVRDEITEGVGVELRRVQEKESTLAALLLSLFAPGMDPEPDLVLTTRAVLEKPFDPSRHYVDWGKTAPTFQLPPDLQAAARRLVQPS